MLRLVSFAVSFFARSVLVALAGCGGGPSFAGTFTGSYQGQEASFVLTRDGGRLGGAVRWAGTESEVRGTVAGRTATGSVRNALMGIELPFEARLDGDALTWTYTVANAFTGQTETLPLALTRAGKGASKRGASASGGIDAALVGRWYSEIGGSLAGGNSAMTRIHVALAADGTFEHGGSDTLIGLRDTPGGPAATGGVQNGNALRGRWKAEGGLLYSQAAGTAQWVPLGRYQLSGTTDLMLYTADGGKQLWSRE